MISTIQPIDPLQMHRHWPFLLRGLESIVRKGKGNVSWWVEDVYSAIQYKAATAYVVSIGQTPVGFTIVHPQAVPFQGTTELLIWIAWSLPLREWNGLAVGEAFMESVRFLANLAIQQGHVALATMTVRRGLLRKYKALFRSEVINCRIPIERLALVAAGV